MYYLHLAIVKAEIHNQIIIRLDYKEDISEIYYLFIITVKSYFKYNNYDLILSAVIFMGIIIIQLLNSIIIGLKVIIAKTAFIFS